MSAEAKKALIVIDMQKAFFADSPLAEQQNQLVTACNELIKNAQKNGATVFLLRTMHEHTRHTWTLNMLDDDAGFLLEGESDTDYVDGLKTDNSIEIIKTRDSGFWQTNLLSQLRQRQIESLVICGVSTHSCVAETASDAYKANLRVELAAGAIASHHPRYHDSTLRMLEQEYRMKSIQNHEITWRT